MQTKILGTNIVDLDTTYQMLIIHSTIVEYLRKKWEYTGAVYHLFTYLQKAYDSIRREILCNILIAFAIPKNLVWLNVFNTKPIVKYR